MNDPIETPDATPDVQQPTASEAASPSPEVAPEVTPEVTPAAPAPEPAPAVEDEPDYDPVPSFNLPSIEPTPPKPTAPASQPRPTLPEVPGLDPTQFTDQYGNVDMGKFTQVMAARDQALTARIAQQVIENIVPNVISKTSEISAQQLMAARAEERAWKKAEEKYPDIATNRELRDLVHKTRLSVIQGGGQDTPVKAADRLFKFIGKARQEGQASATETVQVQAAAAHLESAANTAPDSQTQTRDMMSRVGSKNKAEAGAARQALLKQWMAEGKLNT